MAISVKVEKVGHYSHQMHQLVVVVAAAAAAAAAAMVEPKLTSWGSNNHRRCSL